MKAWLNFYILLNPLQTREFCRYDSYIEYYDRRRNDLEEEQGKEEGKPEPKKEEEEEPSTPNPTPKPPHMEDSD